MLPSSLYVGPLRVILGVSFCLFISTTSKFEQFVSTSTGHPVRLRFPSCSLPPNSSQPPPLSMALHLTCFGDSVSDDLQSSVDDTLRTKFGLLLSLIWDFSLGAVTNLILLPRNASILDDEMDQLKDLRDDLRRKAMHEEAQPNMEVTNQVNGWLQRVQKLDSEVSVFQASLERQSICVSGFCLGYAAAEKLKQVRALIAQRNRFNTVVDYAAPDANTVAREVDDLRVIRDDVMRRVEAEEAANLQMRRTNFAQSWFDKTEACLHSYENGVAVADKLREVRQLKSQGYDLAKGEVVSRVPPDAIEELHSLPSSSIVGGDETLSEIRAHLSDDAVGLIGVYGMGGIGKTTLLKMINNEFFESANLGTFDVVIWVSVSKDMDILNVQRQIGDHLGLSLSSEPSAEVHRQARSLIQALRRKRKFLIFLDDVWVKLDLEAIGIPHPRGNSKIVFTTRSVEVCVDMVADQKVRVKLLNEVESWRLFSKNLQADAILRDPSIQQLAKQVVAKCGGLPLALITVGRAMANKRDPEAWSYAIRALDDSATKLRGMGEVLSALRFNYDRLGNDTMRTCLLYCALFREDEEIATDELIEYWVGEGLLDDEDCWDDHIGLARERGHVIISSLQDACLLESGSSYINRRYKVLKVSTVSLHDTVRDMALNLTSNKYWAMAGKGLQKLPPKRIWESAERISLMHNHNLLWEFPSGTPECPNLSTLLFHGSGLGPSFAEGFFRFMPALRVLDLSRTKIEEVPAEVGSLVQLRYLNLSLTSIRSLPKELGDLTMLRQLDLDHTAQLVGIPMEIVSRLSNLEALKMWYSGYATQREVVDVSGLECLGRLRDLQIDLGTLISLKRLVMSDVLSKCTTCLTVERKMKYTSVTAGGGGDDGNDHGADDPLYGADGSLLWMLIKRLGDHLRRLILYDDPRNKLAGELSFRPYQFPCLEYLSVHSFSMAKIVAVSLDGRRGGAVRPLFPSLRTLEMYGCHGFKDLTWVGGLPCLQQLTLNDCQGVEEVLVLEGNYAFKARDWWPNHAGGSPSFSNLRRMSLYHLPALSSISRLLLRLPSLEELSVFLCPQLKRLPLGPHSAPGIRVIRGEPEWWDGLEWHSHGDDAGGDCGSGSDGGSGSGSGSIKSIFQPRFRRYEMGKMFTQQAKRFRVRSKMAKFEI